MLNIQNFRETGISGDLCLNIEFKCGVPQIISCTFEQRSVSERPKTNKRTNEFKSRLLAVMSGSNRATSAIDALRDDLITIAAPAPDSFFTSLAPKIRGNTRNHIARTKHDVYPDRPDLALQHTVPVADGWFLGTNIANREKRRILYAACALAGLRPVNFSKTRRAN